MKTAKLIFSNNYPQRKDFPQSAVLFYDRKLLTVLDAEQFIHKFENRIPLDAGEQLKDIKNLAPVFAEVADLTKNVSKDSMVFICMGGGTVGDFVGFLASTFKRGVPLVHIPSTWLSAVDSAHGGKNALNIGQHKNQLGTIYPADSIYLIKKLLLNQSAEQFSDSMGEVTKIAMIDGDLLWKKVCNLDNSREKLWKILPLLIKAKNKVVKKDPFEKSGHRYILNLGHTLGHALELSSKISHGRAVALGLRAAIDFSADQKILKSTEIKKISHDCIPSSEDLAAVLRSNKSWQDLLLSDKKRTGAAAVNYVFIKKIGLPVVKKIPVSEFLDFCQKNYL